jgi:hypothetical protein
MLITAGDDDGEQTGNPPSVAQPTPTHSTTPSTQPSSSGGDKGGDDNGDGDKNGGKKDNDKNGGKKDNDKNGGDKNGGDKNGGDKNGGKKDNDTATAAPVPQIPVYVFNQTTVTGLAAATAAELETDGWNVVGVDNWIGTVPQDTVYFYPGDRAAADRLSRDFPAISRVWPASAPMPQGALTVILADVDRK